MAAASAAVPFAPQIAGAQIYPNRPIHVIVGYAAGGGTDIFVRLTCQELTARFGHTYIVEDRPGGGSNLATELVIRAPADGYTLLGTDGAAAINATLYEKLSFNFINDIAVVGLIRGPLVMMVHPSVPAKTVPEFIAYAKAHPGKIPMASAGVGNPSHLAGELFKVMAKVDMTHVPYRGAGPAVADLLGGQVQIFFGSAPAAIDHIRAGRIRALAVTTTTRFEGLPDLPTVADFVPGYDASQWFAIGLRKGSPADIIKKLNQEVSEVLADEKIRTRLLDLGTKVLPGSSEELGRFVAEETEKWGKVVKASGAKAE
ncbi:MAG TPA: tripartite tricarboxylate transporter substrate binding protein [Xanthobacteraceae bacterium]|nr:tripartite tricarboxylate transporter substrate binding protein [Xanthobacteraceae bacterium]